MTLTFEFCEIYFEIMATRRRFKRCAVLFANGIVCQILGFPDL